MKNKTFLIIQIILMYLAILFLWGTLLQNKVTFENLWEYFVIASYALIVFAVIFSLTFVVRTYISLDENVFKNVLIGKIAIIPWYVLIFVTIYFISNLTTEALLTVLLPLNIVLGVGFSVIFLVLSSLPSGICYLRFLRKYDQKISFGIGLLLILNFIPLLDIISAIILKKNFEKIRGEQND